MIISIRREKGRQGFRHNFISLRALLISILLLAFHIFDALSLASRRRILLLYSHH